MLSKDEEVALDEVTRACKTAADHYRELLGLLEESEPGLARLLADLGERREALADRLDRLAESRGRLPVVPDPDREALERLGLRIRSFFGENEQRTLLDQCRSWEEGLAEAAGEALEEDLDEEAAGLVEEILREAREGCRRLAERPR